MKANVIFQEQNCYRLTISIYVHSVKLHAINLRISFSLSPSPSPLPLACFKYTVITTVMHSAIGSNPDNPDKVPAWWVVLARALLYNPFVDFPIWYGDFTVTLFATHNWHTDFYLHSNYLVYVHIYNAKCPHKWLFDVSYFSSHMYPRGAECVASAHSASSQSRKRDLQVSDILWLTNFTVNLLRSPFIIFADGGFPLQCKQSLCCYRVLVWMFNYSNLSLLILACGCWVWQPSMETCFFGTSGCHIGWWSSRTRSRASSTLSIRHRWIVFVIATWTAVHGGDWAFVRSFYCLEDQQEMKTAQGEGMYQLRNAAPIVI